MGWRAGVKLQKGERADADESGEGTGHGEKKDEEMVGEESKSEKATLGANEKAGYVSHHSVFDYHHSI